MTFLGTDGGRSGASDINLFSLRYKWKWKGTIKIREIKTDIGATSESSVSELYCPSSRVSIDIINSATAVADADMAPMHNSTTKYLFLSKE